MRDFPALNEELVERVDALGATAISLIGYRHTSPHRDPLSGAGARISGGRWNPRGVPTIYLASPEAAALSELQHLADMAGVKFDSLLRAGRVLHTVEVMDLNVLDLREEKARNYVGIATEDMRDDDWSACNAVGQAAWFLQFAGIIAPSARHDGGQVVAVFEDRIVGELSCIDSRPLLQSSETSTGGTPV